jgi:hypothetical protein
MEGDGDWESFVIFLRKKEEKEMTKETRQVGKQKSKKNTMKRGEISTMAFLEGETS